MRNLRNPFLAAACAFVALAALRCSGKFATGSSSLDASTTDSPSDDDVIIVQGDDGGAASAIPGDSGACTVTAPCNDFAGSPGATCSGGACVVIGPGATAGAPALFGPSGSGASGGPCLVEPQDGTLFPNGGPDGSGWLRPRVSFSPSSSAQDLFEIRFHSPVEENDLVVYTASTYWALDVGTWVALSKDLVGPAVTVTVRAASAGGGAVTVGNSSDFTIASVQAPGALIYWSVATFDNSATSTSLSGFHVGDTGSALVLTSSQVTQQVVGAPVDGGQTSAHPVGVYCIGCHVPTPDDKFVAFTAQWPWANALASPDPATTGQAPSWLTAGAVANLNPLSGSVGGLGPWFDPPQINQVMLGIQAFSSGHYATGDRMVVTTLGAAEDALSDDAAVTQTGVVSQLAWINLEYSGPVATDSGLPVAPCGTDPAPPSPCLTPQTRNGGWGVIARTGTADLGSAGAPSWSHDLDGKTDVIAYTSTRAGTEDGRLNDGPADILLVPYTSLGPGLGGAGGVATALPGASDPSYNEYYPAWGPDDSLMAFNRVPSGLKMYNQPAAEVYVVPSSGTAATCDGVSAPQCRLKANDPAACSGSASPGVQNTWPKWAPLPNAMAGANANKGTDGKLHYWVAFSSTRVTGCTVTGSNLCSSTQSARAAGKAQIYVAGIAVDPAHGNAITTYPAIYLWNQGYATNNMIPAWGNFPLPPGTGNQPSL
jgi:hypothetical protein